MKNIGVTTIGSLAKLPRKDLHLRWGVNGEILWLNANGIDYSSLNPFAQEQHKGVGHSITLPRDYRNQREIQVILLEVTEEVCRRVRQLNCLGNVINLYCRGADFQNPMGFSRQKKLYQPSDTSSTIYPEVLNLFEAHWQYYPVRALGISLSQLQSNSSFQMSLFSDQSKDSSLNSTVDSVRDRFGTTSIFRASSLSTSAQFFQRATKVGGHEA
ncbi:nucleotidyltransferase/DNA polymerase involved in DNA repair [Desulfitispora alkaliphila]